ncbi:MAG: Spy/CpxP family protein refolding chaperone [Endomicrobiales bacterium]|jgi:Spy/CpxP family protein refolding chaperone
MKGFVVCVIMYMFLIASSLFCDDGTNQNNPQNQPKIPTIYGPDSQRVRPNPQPPAPSRQQAQPQPQAKSNDMLNGNIGEIAQFSRELNITDDQIQSLQAIENEFQKKAVDLDGTIRMIRIDISRALKNEAPDFKSVEEKVKTISDLQYQIRGAILEAYEKAYNLLTQEQKTKYVQLVTTQKQTTPMKPSGSTTRSSSAGMSQTYHGQTTTSSTVPQASPQ